MRSLLAVMLAASCGGCAVVTVASTAVSVTAGAVGLVADAAIGTAKLVGKGVGKAADAVLGDDRAAAGSVAPGEPPQ